MPEYFCIDCNAVREMNKHGKCSTCDSRAINVSSPTRVNRTTQDHEKVSAMTTILAATVAATL